MLPLPTRLTIRAPVSAVFRLYTDAARIPEWQPGVRGVRELTGPLEVPGTTYVLDQPGPELRIRAMRVEPPRLHEQVERVRWYAWRTTARFDQAPGRSTRLTSERTYVVPGPLGWLVAPYVTLIGWLFARSELVRLKAVAERDERLRPTAT